MADLYRQVQDGVLRVQASTCSGSGIGTGFLVGSDRLVTAAHVVAGAVSLAVDDGAANATSGTVLGVDPTLDVALVQLARPSSGHVFTLSEVTPGPGSTVAAIGFPLNQPKTLTRGTISGVERTITVTNGTELTHLLQMDVPVNPGNSGGPLLDENGDVVGIVSASLRDAQGINYAASASLARPLVATWQASPQPPAQQLCTAPLGPQTDQTSVAPPSGASDLERLVAETLTSYFQAVNSGRYADAQRRQAPSRRLPPASFANGMSTTYVYGIRLNDLSPAGRGAVAWVTFTSLQAGDKGPRPDETCTQWSIDYTLIPANDGLLWIDSATGHAGPISRSCS